jgi:hypothetical protein
VIEAGPEVESFVNQQDQSGDGYTDCGLTWTRAIKAFALAERTIVLPAHDPDGAARLAARAIYVPGVNNCTHTLKSTR